MMRRVVQERMNGIHGEVLMWALGTDSTKRPFLTPHCCCSVRRRRRRRILVEKEKKEENEEKKEEKEEKKEKKLDVENTR